MTQSGSLPVRPRLRRMLEARTVAVVGASERPDSFGWRMATEVLRSPGIERVYLVHPRRDTVLGQPCLPSLADVPEPVDLVLLGVPGQGAARPGAAGGGAGRRRGGRLRRRARAPRRRWSAAARRAWRSAAAAAWASSTPSRGVRAIGYIERDPLPPGPIALVTHSGLGLLRRCCAPTGALEYSLAVSSGQELVTTAADYLTTRSPCPETRVVGLVLETMRDADAAAGRARRRGRRGTSPSCALTVGDLDARAGAGRRALRRASPVGRGAGRRCSRRTACTGSTTSTSSPTAWSCSRSAGGSGGAGRRHRHRARLGSRAGAGRRRGRAPRRDRSRPLAEPTTDGWPRLLDPGLSPTNPLDVWGTGAATPRTCSPQCLTALADDATVDVVALAVDLVPEYDGDDRYPKALEHGWSTTPTSRSSC